MPQESPALKEQLAVAVPDARAGREGAGGDAEPGRRPVTRAARGRARRGALPRSAGFWLVAGVLFLLLFVSGAASPLYGVYQAQWRFSAATLTAVFSVYALVLLVTLLVFGSVSDYLGRRRVIAVALVAGAGACGLFLAAHGAGLLFAARALTGASAGAATSAGGAALIDLQPEGSGRAPVVTSASALLGLGAGGLGTSALVQYAPAPTHLIWWLLLGACAAAVAVLAIPETTPGRAGVLASLRPRVVVPPQARGTLAVALPSNNRAPVVTRDLRPGHVAGQGGRQAGQNSANASSHLSPRSRARASPRANASAARPDRRARIAAQCPAVAQVGPGPRLTVPVTGGAEASNAVREQIRDQRSLGSTRGDEQC